jgi:hypothetical protein
MNNQNSTTTDTNKNPDTNKTPKTNKNPKEEYSKYNIFKNHSYGSLYQRINFFLNTKLINLILFILLIFTIVITTYLLRSKTLHKNHKFNVFLQLLSSLGALALGATLILTIVSQKETNAMQAIQNFDSLYQKFTETLELFMEHPEINYYYNELFGLQHLNYGIHYKRHRDLENQITNKIFNTITSFIYFNSVNDYKPTVNSSIIEKRMKKILDMHVKSPIFLENWEMYKKTIATSMLIGYMKHHYNL